MDIAEHQIAKRIRELRERYRLTLQQVAERAGLSKSFLSKVERSSVSISIPPSLASPTPLGFLWENSLKMRKPVSTLSLSLGNSGGSSPEAGLNSLIITRCFFRAGARARCRLRSFPSMAPEPSLNCGNILASSSSLSWRERWNTSVTVRNLPCAPVIASTSKPTFLTGRNSAPNRRCLISLFSPLRTPGAGVPSLFFYLKRPSMIFLTGSIPAGFVIPRRAGRRCVGVASLEFGQSIPCDNTIVSEGFQARQCNAKAVHLEKSAQRGTRVAPPEAVCP